MKIYNFLAEHPLTLQHPVGKMKRANSFGWASWTLQFNAPVWNCDYDGNCSFLSEIAKLSLIILSKCQTLHIVHGTQQQSLTIPYYYVLFVVTRPQGI
jgi:hypothetical protein